MLRVVGGPGDRGSRIENRVGEPAANPYLYLASQIYAGLDGICNALEPSSPVDAPYDTEAEPLPRSLVEATQALRKDRYFREKFGAQFIDYLLHIKDAEITRSCQPSRIGSSGNILKFTSVMILKFAALNAVRFWI